MINITKERLNEIKNNFLNKKIAVIGDMMLDGYLWGDVKRISPEAPVPVVEIDDEFFRFGGAANVALNIKTLGGTPSPVGIIGEDIAGKRFRSLLRDAKMNSDGIIFDNTRPTTAKTRVIANNQHVVRIDRENKDYIPQNIEKNILDYLFTIIEELDGIILQDYNKGVLTENLIRKIISLGNKYKKTIAVDPKFNNFFAYKGATIFKPNRKETEDALGTRLDTEQATKDAGEILIKKLKAKYVMITLGQDGVAIFDGAKPEKRIPTKARKVRDVSGAGDTVISTLTLALAAGADIHEAAYLANYAGGLACEEVGIVPIELNNLFHRIGIEFMSENNVCTLEEIKEIRQKLKAGGKTIVFTNGCFDVLHAGHVDYLRKSKSCGDILVVGINSDLSVQNIKGNKRPIIKEEERAFIISNLKCVDYVLLFDDDTPEILINEIEPDVLVKGADWSKENIVGAEFVESYGGKVERIKFVSEQSTSKIINTILERYKD